MRTSKPVLTDADRASYPIHLLEGCDTGLCLFAAAFLGQNDAAHFEAAGLMTTCVDTDADRLGQMMFYYPTSWPFITGDAWAYAETARAHGFQWDAVSVDPFTGGTGDRALDDLHLWFALARKFVTITVPRGSGVWLAAGDWDVSVHVRSDTASWLVLERT